MGLVQLYSTPKSNDTADDMSTTTPTTTLRCLEEIQTFCNCNQRTDRPPNKNASEHAGKAKCTLSIVPKQMMDMPKPGKFIQLPVDVCRCGEDTCQTIDWTWDARYAQPQTVIDNTTVLFHPYYSQGTSIVRGSEPLAHNMIHYFEIKIVHWFSGTDLVSVLFKLFFFSCPFSFGIILCKLTQPSFITSYCCWIIQSIYNIFSSCPIIFG